MKEGRSAMSVSDIFALLPYIIVAGTAITVMMVTAFRRSHRLTAAVTIAGLSLAFISILQLPSFYPRQITSLIILDRYACFYLSLIFSAAMAVGLFSYGYLEKRNGIHEEFYLLMLIAALGAAVLVASSHFVSLFLGIETLSVSLYALLAYHRSAERGIEAGVKYLVLAAVSSAFLLFGMALLYAETGTMEFGRLAEAAVQGGEGMVFLTGTVLVVTGLGFKLAVVPFHLWTPDVYEGAPAPVTAFVATISKGAVFALLLRYFGQEGLHLDGPLLQVFTLIAAASMFTGNLLALLQNNVKRILAYSSIAHLGYLLVAFLAGGKFAVTAVTFYLVAYIVTTLGAFGVITLLSGSNDEADTIDHYRSLAWERPWIAAVFTAMLLSLAGIPLTAGFLGKFYILAAGVRSALWFLTVILVINSAIGLFYYLRVIVVMFQRPEAEAGDKKTPAPPLSAAGSVMLTVLVFLLVWFGVFPGFIIGVIQKISVMH
jgi:NADH-quinone oxidoreductase subunit N